MKTNCNETVATETYIEKILPYFGKKEASDIPSNSELFMFSYCTQCALLPGQILCTNTHPAKRYVR